MVINPYRNAGNDRRQRVAMNDVSTPRSLGQNEKFQEPVSFR